MRIAAWCHNYPPHPGGAEVIAQSLATALVAAGHEVAVVSTRWAGAPRRQLERGVEVFRLPAVHLTEKFDVPYPVPVGSGGRALSDAVGSRQVHHAYGSLYPTTLLATRARRRTRTPLILTEHVGFVRYASGLLNAVQNAAWLTIGRYTTRRAAALVAYNSRVQRWLADFSGRPVELIRNGIDLEAFRPARPGEKAELRRAFGLPPDPVLGLFVGRAAAKKNLEPLLESPRERFRLVCCGATGRNLPPDVVDLGLVPHSGMPDLYRACDFMIHLGVGEGFPVALQEAAATGLPLLILWDPGYEAAFAKDAVVSIESLSELDEALDRITASAELRGEFGLRARRSVEGEGWNRTASRYLELFESVSKRQAREGAFEARTT